eukprot:160266-Pelagomonas_calceolata.AAC.3
MGILRNGALIAWVQEWASSRAVEARKCDSGRAVEFSGTGAWPWSRALVIGAMQVPERTRPSKKSSALSAQLSFQAQEHGLGTGH